MCSKDTIIYLTVITCNNILHKTCLKWFYLNYFSKIVNIHIYIFIVFKDKKKIVGTTKIKINFP